MINIRQLDSERNRNIIYTDKYDIAEIVIAKHKEIEVENDTLTENKKETKDIEYRQKHLELLETKTNEEYHLTEKQKHKLHKLIKDFEKNFNNLCKEIINESE